MTALLTYNLPLLVDAPNGIKKLRELILELAVRGKLVPQDPYDEPANYLLTRITAEKARLAAEGKIKKQTPMAAIAAEEKPFELPSGWVWSRINDLAILRGGSTPSMSKSEFWNGEVPWVSPKDMHSGAITNSELKVTRRALEETSLDLIPIGSILIVGRSGILKRKLPVQISAVVCTINQDLKAISPFQPLQARYIQLMLQGTERQILAEDVKQGTTVQSLIYEKLFSRLFGLPPLAEQNRIAAKVDELMVMCDRLEAQQADAESAHAQLVQALLDSLAQADDVTDFTSNWQRLVEHFHTLFTTEPSIDALKQTLLQLAVMGKLAPQVSNDEPADKLLARLAKDRSDYAALHKVAVTKPEPISASDRRLSLPGGWTWTRLCSMFRVITDGDHQPPPKSNDGVAFLTIGNVTKGHLDFSNCRFVPQDYFNKIALYRRPEIGDILYTVVGATYGRPIAVDSSRAFCVQRHIAILKGSELLNSAFACYLLSSPWVYEQATQSTTGTAQPTIPLRPLRNFLVMLPPLAEQHRIVAKVDQLMAICNQLKIRLTQARQLNEQLACTLVERALSEDGQRAPIATDRQVARTLLAAEITHRLHSQRTFGQRKLQKVIYLAEHAARLAAIQGDYLRDAAGPHDRQLMNKVEGELQNHHWYERIERETIGHAYRPLSQAGQHREAYSSAWSVAERATIEQVIELMRDWDTDRCEMTVTLYAAWNDFILEGHPVSDEAIVDEVMHSWNDTKLRFGKAEWLAVLAEMKKHKILMPSGFGKRTTGGMLSLPGFE